MVAVVLNFNYTLPESVKDIARETYLPARTVRYALNKLKEEKILQEHFYFQDVRQSLYGLNFNAPEMVTG